MRLNGNREITEVCGKYTLNTFKKDSVFKFNRHKKMQ